MRGFVGAALFVAAALEGSPQDRPGLASGPLVFGAFAAELSENGTFRLEGEGWPTFTGTWNALGTVLTLSSSGGGDDCAAPGRYRFAREGDDVLQLRLVDFTP